jgi:hypothetical protein
MAIRVNTGFEVNTQLPIDLRTIANTTTDRNAISASWRFEGLAVYVLDIEKEYRLIGGTTNANWVEWPISSSYALSSSYTLNADTASYSFFSVTTSFTQVTQSVGVVTSASWASASYFSQIASSSINALSASWASQSLCSDNLYVLTASNNSLYSLTFISGAEGCQPFYRDSADDLTYNPGTNTLTINGDVIAHNFIGTASIALTASNAISSSYALTASYISGSAIGMVPSASFAISASWAPGGTTSNSSSWASQSLSSSYSVMSDTASLLENSRSNFQSIHTLNYLAGNLIVDNGPNNYSDVLSILFGAYQSAYVNVTIHNWEAITGSADFYGEYLLVKESTATTSQPGCILEQNNIGPVMITSQLYDPGATASPSVLTIQLKTDGAVLSSSVLTYEIRGKFLLAPTASSPAFVYEVTSSANDSSSFSVAFNQGSLQTFIEYDYISLMSSTFYTGSLFNVIVSGSTQMDGIPYMSASFLCGSLFSSTVTASEMPNDSSLFSSTFVTGSIFNTIVTSSLTSDSSSFNTTFYTGSTNLVAIPTPLETDGTLMSVAFYTGSLT